MHNVQQHQKLTRKKRRNTLKITHAKTNENNTSTNKSTMKKKKENKLSRDIPQRIIHVTCQVIIYFFIVGFQGMALHSKWVLI